MAAAAAEGAAAPVAAAMRAVLARAGRAAERSGRAAEAVRVVAIGKTKPVSLLRQLYDAGHRCFGENYVQEFVTKAPQLPEDIRWHFVGHLQSNKVKSLVGNEKIANHLDRAVVSLGREPLKVMVQVNTSGEESKSGIDPSKCVELAKHVKLACPNLILSGLMTIGMKDYSSTPENFKALANCKLEVCKALGIPTERFELSMGMSGDFEQAIELGSTNVRVGSTIFGPREYPNQKQN
ncbi:pyridoxal phosphate homeostasis protein-like isoform X2 [Triticum dicoccoides]|uniref:pyridoxal phosphate homeostasis protein-like isoform X2 n=1 Tax=Triticum dicoccoides TaxID=85692 RepID=UPI00188EA781|nr:pyridoxal phosphate homeostasis protein-like isoform X2 [Triticum dicoccoides]